MPHLTAPTRRMILGASAGIMLVGRASAQTGPVRGGRIIASMDLQPRSLDPIMGDAPTSDRYPLIQMYQSLVRFDAKGMLVPWLAASWEYADDNAALLFRLRPGVKFHDGTDFDAEAVAYNIRRTIDPATNAPRSPRYVGRGRGGRAGPHDGQGAAESAVGRSHLRLRG